MILTVLTSIIVSAVISQWYISRMARQNEIWMKKFFQEYEDSYKHFLEDLKKSKTN